MTKIAIINHAVQGCGKSTMARCVMTAVTAAGLSCSCHSTDDYFMQEGRYCFDHRQLSDYHQRNQEAFTADLANQVDVVICDNTNLVPWQAEPYVNAARQYGYRILLLDLQPRPLPDLIASQQVTAERPEAHQIPEVALQKALDTYRTFPVRHFVYDEIISIPPAGFSEAQRTIGQQVLALATAAG